MTKSNSTTSYSFLDHIHTLNVKLFNPQSAIFCHLFHDENQLFFNEMTCLFIQAQHIELLKGSSTGRVKPKTINYYLLLLRTQQRLVGSESG